MLHLHDHLSSGGCQEELCYQRFDIAAFYANSRAMRAIFEPRSTTKLRHSAAALRSYRSTPKRSRSTTRNRSLQAYWVVPFTTFVNRSDLTQNSLATLDDGMSGPAKDVVSACWHSIDPLDGSRDICLDARGKFADAGQCRGGAQSDRTCKHPPVFGMDFIRIGSGPDNLRK
jgi:hypothetical protein